MHGFPCFIFFVARTFLAFLSISPSFPGMLGVQHREKVLAFWGGFSFSKKKRKEDQGTVGFFRKSSKPPLFSAGH